MISIRASLAGALYLAVLLGPRSAGSEDGLPGLLLAPVLPDPNQIIPPSVLTQLSARRAEDLRQRLQLLAAARRPASAASQMGGGGGPPPDPPGPTRGAHCVPGKRRHSGRSHRGGGNSRSTRTVCSASQQPAEHLCPALECCRGGAAPTGGPQSGTTAAAPPEQEEDAPAAAAAAAAAPVLAEADAAAPPTQGAA